jgi:hypothetical protein
MNLNGKWDFAIDAVAAWTSRAVKFDGTIILRAPKLLLCMDRTPKVPIRQIKKATSG